MTGPVERGPAEAVEDRFESDQVPFFRALVEQPSCTREPDDVEAALALYDARMSALGFRVERHADPEGRFADHRVYARGAGSATLLVGHMDTVFPRSMGFFGFRRDGDTVRGPGVLDMKSGLSSIVAALEALQGTSGFEELPVRVVCVSDEEVGSPSSRRLFETLAPEATQALVFEGGRSEDRVITGRKGGAFYRVRAEGRAAHAGVHHEDGVNAIWALSIVIPKLQALTRYEVGTTVNVGLISGGTAKNTVPDEASCDVDVRFETSEEARLADAAVRAVVSEPSEVEGATLALEGGMTRPPMVASAASQALRQRYETFAAQAGLQVGEAPLQGGGSDANLLSALGVPSIDGLGPFGKHFHRTDEWSSLDSLKRRTVALAAFLSSLA